MRKIKKYFIFIIFVILISFNNVVYADDEFDEEFDFAQIDEFLQTVNSEANKLPNINSRHAIVYDRNSGVILYGKKENERCKMASTTKIMSAIIVLEYQEDLNEKTKVSARAAGTGGSRLGLHKDDEISINDLLYGLLLCSRK